MEIQDFDKKIYSVKARSIVLGILGIVLSLILLFCTAVSFVLNGDQIYILASLGILVMIAGFLASTISSQDINTINDNSFNFCFHSNVFCFVVAFAFCMPLYGVGFLRVATYFLIFGIYSALMALFLWKLKESFRQKKGVKVLESSDTLRQSAGLIEAVINNDVPKVSEILKTKGVTLKPASDNLPGGEDLPVLN